MSCGRPGESIAGEMRLHLGIEIVLFEGDDLRFRGHA